MTEEKKRLYSIVGWSTLFIIPLWSFGIWGFGGIQYLKPYCFLSVASGLSAAMLLLFRRNYLFWYFIICLLAYFPSMVLGLSLNTGLVCILAFGKYVSPLWIMIGTLLFFSIYCYFPIKYYHDDYYQTEKDCGCRIKIVPKLPV